MFMRCVSVVKECPRLCSRGTDRMFCFERELAGFMRSLMELVYSAASIPDEFDIQAVIRHSGAELAAVDTVRYQVLFEQYFRFDVSPQKPYFYRAVQKFFHGVCIDLATEIRTGWLSALSLTPFDPELIRGGSEDRRVDALVGTCAVLCDYDLLEYDDGGIVAQQYREFTSYFKMCGLFAEGIHVSNIYETWMNFPYWTRCRELERVFHFGVAATYWNCYNSDFEVVATDALPDDLQLSSVHFVRSWLSVSFRGYTKSMLTGLMRHCESTDMQVSRLTDKDRAEPWDQSLRVGLNDVLARGLEALQSTNDARPSTSVDSYRSAVCEQLDALEPEVRSPRLPSEPVVLTSPNVSRLSGKRPKRQSDVRLENVASTSAVTGKQGVQEASTSGSGKKSTGGRQTAKKTSGRSAAKMRKAPGAGGVEDEESPVVQRKRMTGRGYILASDDEA